MSSAQKDKNLSGLNESEMVKIFREPFGPIPVLEEVYVADKVNFDSDEELIKSIFPEKTYEKKYKRVVVDIELLWKSQTQRKKPKTENIVHMPKDYVLETYIKNYKNS